MVAQKYKTWNFLELRVRSLNRGHYKFVFILLSLFETIELCSFSKKYTDIKKKQSFCTIVIFEE